MLKALLSKFGNSCDNATSFFDFPTWYKYLETEENSITGRCEVVVGFTDGDFSDIALIGLAVVDIALRIAALAAVGFIIYGGVQFITAQGEADKSKTARQTIINAIIGLVVALVAAGVVSFIGGVFR